MANNDPGAPEYEFDWQNPDKQSFDVGRALSQAFTSLWASPRTLLMAMSVGLGLTILSSLVMTSQIKGILENTPPEEFMLSGAYWGWSFGIGLFGLLLTVWFQLIVVQTSYAAITKTENPSNIFGLALRLTVPMFITALIYVIVCYLGMIPILIGFIFVWPGWALAGPMMVHEKKGVFSSLGASWSFSRGSKRYILLLLLIMSIIGMVVYSVTLGIGMMATGINIMAGDPTAAFNMSIGQQLIYNGVAGLGGYILYALFASGVTSAYVEIKRINGGVGDVGDVFS